MATVHIYEILNIYICTCYAKYVGTLIYGEESAQALFCSLNSGDRRERQHMLTLSRSTHPDVCTWNVEKCSGSGNSLHTASPHTAESCVSTMSGWLLYLADKTSFESTILDNGSVCMACYKSQLFITKEALVSNLVVLIDELRKSMPPIQAVQSVGNVMNWAMYSTEIHVWERLLWQESLLLPSVHHIFCAFVFQVSHTANVRNEECSVTGKW